MAKKFGRIIVSAAAVRRKPRHQSEMVNQLLFGEEVEITRQKDERWVRVRSTHDRYEGWMTRHLLQEVEASGLNPAAPVIAGGLFNRVTVDGRSLVLPFCSVMPANTVKEDAAVLINRPGQAPGFDLLRALALPWLGAPYLWGGRTPMGVDCSGLVQVLFRAMGMDLPRDAWQQAREGKAIGRFREAQPGDLLFFDAGEEIVHVGILMEDGSMFHASGTVRFDRVNKKGIVYEKKVKRRLKLRGIRRVF